MSKKPPRKNNPPASRTVSGGKLWLFRLIMAIGGPLILLAMIELCLRLGGYGYPTHFVLSSANNGQKTFIQNNQFGWRFFGRQMAREPFPFSIPQVKPPGTIRIFVFGESAAYGDPEPRFGLSRMIEAQLSLRYPGTRFEVVNTGMTGINSHTILPIARDCASANGDIWVVYMGNNEVVGPFGAGTVFGQQAPPMPMIRTDLEVKATRTGQLLDSLREHLHKPPLEKSEWGGMLMFLDNQVSADDRRMQTVYHHFARNLDDIIGAGRGAGVGIVLSTVAVNLKDCAPYASAHRSGLPGTDKDTWNQFYQKGIEAQNAGHYDVASESFRRAAQIDDAFAELRFRQGQCALNLGQIPDAQKQFEAARQLDTLRFRCDERLNELTRAASGSGTGSRILLADAERTFGEQSPSGLPGEDLFFDHVHLTFEGNYLLARTVTTQIEKLLPATLTASASTEKPWPAIEECSRRLCWTDADRKGEATDMLARLSEPPFTGQANHDAQIRHLTALIEKLSLTTQPEALREAIKLAEAEVIAVPYDPWLFAQLASWKQSSGDMAGAAQAAQREMELLPSTSEGWSKLGLILVQQKKYDEAAHAFERACQVDSDDVWSRQNLAQALIKLNRRDEAILEYKLELAIKPRFGLAWLGLGQALEAAGRKTEAEECYQKALSNRIHRAPELATLARFCVSRGWLEAATTNFNDAINLNPTDPMLRVEAGQVLAARGHHADAEQVYAEASRMKPELGQAHFLYGTELGGEGKLTQAVEQFRAAARLMPDVVEARINLGIALANEGQTSEALAEFEGILKRYPENAIAQKYVTALKAKTISPSNR